MHKRVIQLLKFGFLKSFSTLDVIIKLIEDIEKSLDNKQSVCAVFIDLQKAFDTVNHNILLDKPSHYGTRDTANSWFSPYLTTELNLLQLMVFILIYEMFKKGYLKDRLQAPFFFFSILII